MAAISENKRRGKGKPFQAGKSGNPRGRPALTPGERAAKTMTRETFAVLVQLIMTKRKEELEDLLAGGLPYEEELFIRHMLELGEDPDWNQYERYLSRRIGKVPDEVVIEQKPTVTIEKRDGTRVVLGVDDGTEEEA